MSLTLIAQAELSPSAAEPTQVSGETPPASNPAPPAGQSAAPESSPVQSPPAILRPEELSTGLGMPSAPPEEISVQNMFLNADPVVQAVMVLLLLASAATWLVIFEKTLILRRASRMIRQFKKAAARQEQKINPDDFPELSLSIVKTGLKESGDNSGAETRSEYRERVERSMRAELSGLMDRLGGRTAFLASVGSVSPFVGLFGTVWGIMHSFIGIAASGETTLAVVAPGIAEALFATAMGLVAAIPAVIAYNKITATLKKITKEALAGIGLAGNHLARLHFSAGE